MRSSHVVGGALVLSVLGGLCPTSRAAAGGPASTRPAALPIIAHWSFDRDAGGRITDTGPNKLHGKLTGEPAAKVQHVPGRVGTAIQLPADHKIKIELPASPLLDLKPPFTVAAWIKRTGGPSSQEILSRYWDGGVTGYRFRYGWGMIQFMLGDGKQAVVASTPHHTVEEAKWVHAAAVHDGKTIRIFLNAEPSVEVKCETAPAKEAAAPVIGNYLGRPDAYPFVGLIDELCIIGKALSGKELFDLAAPAPMPGTRAAAR